MRCCRCPGLPIGHYVCAIALSRARLPYMEGRQLPTPCVIVGESKGVEGSEGPEKPGLSYVRMAFGCQRSGRKLGDLGMKLSI